MQKTAKQRNAIPDAAAALTRWLPIRGLQHATREN